MVGLPEFFKKVDSSYYELHPYNAGRMTGVPLEDRRKLFQPYNPTPESIKAISDRSQSLLKELNKMDINRKLLLARERSMIAQADHFLRHYFGRPYENNYLSGKAEFSAKVLVNIKGKCTIFHLVAVSGKRDGTVVSSLKPGSRC